MSQDLQIPEVTVHEFHGEAALDGSALRLRLEGNADVRVMGPLEALVESVQRAAERLRVSEVTVDTRALEFIASSCCCRSSIRSW